MDWGRLFLSAEGRIRQQDYWIGVLILIGLWVVSHLAHIFAPLIWLILVYPWVCVITKRLHDFGRSGWLILVPVVVGFLCACAAVVVGGVAVIGAFFAASTDSGADMGSWAGVLGALGIALVFIAIAAVVKLIFLLWVGLHGGDAGPNRYGPPPGEAAAPSPPAPL
jgi:uncharacterized membrane protein YhaH (DUF805 family)